MFSQAVLMVEGFRGAENLKLERSIQFSGYQMF